MGGSWLPFPAVSNGDENGRRSFTGTKIPKENLNLTSALIFCLGWLLFDLLVVSLVGGGTSYLKDGSHPASDSDFLMLTWANECEGMVRREELRTRCPQS